jgi:hypothetical protein
MEDVKLGWISKQTIKMACRISKAFSNPVKKDVFMFWFQTTYFRHSDNVVAAMGIEHLTVEIASQAG